MSKFFCLTLIVFATSFVHGQFDETYSKKLINFVAASFLPVNDSSDIFTKEMASLCFKKSYPNGDWELLNISFINPCTRFNIDLCQVLIAKSEKYKEIIFAFQGYVYPDQIKFFANLTFDNFIPWIFDGNGRDYGKVISDFSEASEAVWNSHVKDVLNKYSDYSITFTGHSLGGSIASLIALKTKLVGFNQIMKVYTFGEPRAGDLEWAKIFQVEIPQAYRVVHSSDLLPHMPVCQRLFSGSCDKNLGYPYHQPQEIWYNDYLMSDGKYKICDIFNGEDPNCSNSIPESQFNKNLIEWQGFDMQMRYYGQRLYDYGNAGCEDLSDNRSSTTATTIEVSSMTASTKASAAADAGLRRNYFLVVISCYYFLINHFILKQ